MFAERFSNDNYKLKIAIRNNKSKYIVCFKYLINQNQNSDFRRRFFVRDFIKNIIMFFEKFVDHDANNVVFIRFKKIDDEIYNNILSTFIDYDDENQ